MNDIEEPSKPPARRVLLSGLVEMIAMIAALAGAVITSSNFFDWNVIKDLLQKATPLLQIIGTAIAVLGTLFAVANSLYYKSGKKRATGKQPPSGKKHPSPKKAPSGKRSKH